MLDISTLEIAVETPTSHDSRALIDDSDAALAKHYSKEQCFSFSVDELTAPNVEFLVARRAGQAVGCVALVDCLTYGEVKRLYVRDEARGAGIGMSLMAAAEQAARDVGLRVIRLETGARLAAAVAIYKARGYRQIPAFGDYPAGSASQFFERTL